MTLRTTTSLNRGRVQVGWVFAFAGVTRDTGLAFMLGAHPGVQLGSQHCEMGVAGWGTHLPSLSFLCHVFDMWQVSPLVSYLSLTHTQQHTHPKSVDINVGFLHLFRGQVAMSLPVEELKRMEEVSIHMVGGL